MTAVVEDDQTVTADEDTTAAEATGSENGDETDDEKKSRDFSKFTEKHKELADFINANEDYQKAELSAITPQQVKAVLALRTDFNDTPEVKAERAKRKAEREEEKKQFEGLSAEQIKAEKAARRAEATADKLRKRVEEAMAKAAAIREGKDASGEDVAAAVEAAQSVSATPVVEDEAVQGSLEDEDAPQKRTIGRQR